MNTNLRLYPIFILLLYFFPYGLFSQTDNSISEKEWEVFPILNYDTDLGFGYGAKGFIYNFLNTGESFDATIFNSTNGERWYQFIYSSPDMQRRLGRKYKFGFDFILDYDKYINYKFYRQESDYFYQFDPSGNLIESKEEEEYIREPIEIKAVFSRGFTKDFVAELGVLYRSVSCYGFDKEGLLQFRQPSHVEHLSILFNFRLDTRTNFINPQKGILFQIGNEYASNILGKGESFYKFEIIFQSYFQLYFPKVISATRIRFQTVSDVNYQNKLFLGGNSSLRGLPQSRYLSQSSTLINQEIRFPIWWRFGGIAGVDIGNSTSTPNWILNPVAGLRFNMDNFIVRFDVGFGSENTGFYFNFGHLF